MRKAYCYLFYKLYKFWESISIPKFWSDAKAILIIAVLQGFTALSLMVYYKVFFNESSHLLTQKWIYVVIGLFCFLPNYFFFYRTDYWKQIVHQYDKWPERKNNKGSISVGLFIFFIIVNFIVACCLYKNS